jgi:hypothetical protein
VLLNRIRLSSPDYHPYHHGGYYYTVQKDRGDNPVHSAAPGAGTRSNAE